MVALPALIVFALAVKLSFFPSAKDAWFEMDQQSLEHVPSGLVLIRPTHFSRSLYRRGIAYDPNERSPTRIMGRDVSLRDMIAVAYDESPARVILPPDAPTSHFDCIVTTTTTDPRQRLAKTIRDKFGYTALKEMRDTTVLALKVKNASLPSLTISGPGEKRTAFYKHGQYYLKHFKLNPLLSDFEQFLKTPIVDETGLTNDYDFSLPWNIQLVQQLNNENTARPALDKVLATIGLRFEPATTSLEMLIVRKRRVM